jgi:hypothetical protein
MTILPTHSFQLTEYSKSSPFAFNRLILIPGHSFGFTLCNSDCSDILFYFPLARIASVVAVYIQELLQARLASAVVVLIQGLPLARIASMVAVLIRDLTLLLLAAQESLFVHWRIVDCGPCGD